MKKLLVTVLCALCVIINLNAKVYYVAPNGNDANSADSWGNAVQNIQIAIDKAVSGDEIWLKAGEYTLTSNYIPGTTSGGEAGAWLKDGVSIYGSFAGTETSPEDRARLNPVTEPWAFTHQTVILGGVKKDGTTPLRLFDRADKVGLFTTTSIVDGLTVRDYNSNSSRHFYMKEKQVLNNCAFINCSDNSSVVYFEDGGTIKNSLFEGCKHGLYVRGVGGANAEKDEVRETISVLNCTFTKANNTVPLSIYNTGNPEDESPTVKVHGCLFASNDIALPVPYETGKYSAAAITLNHGNKKRFADISGCVFEDNTYRKDGASTMMINGGGKFNIYNNIFRNNKLEKDEVVAGQSAIFVLYVQPELGNIFNNLFVNNTSNAGLFYLVEPIFFNNTVANNYGSMYAPNAPVVLNNIFSNNHVVNEETSTSEDAPLKMTEDTYATYMFNANSVEVTLGESMDNYVSDNVMFTNAGFAAPTSFIGTGDSQAVNSADYSLSIDSPAKGIADILLLGEEGLGYSQAWFDTYFSKDLAGNDRATGDEMNAGAYEGANESGVKIYKADPFSAVYVVGKTLNLNTEEKSVVSLYDASGRQHHSLRAEIGQNTFETNLTGLCIIQVISESGKSNVFKVMIP